LKKFIIFIITLFIAKIYILKILNIDLFYDEAYYYYWSKHLAFGYYSKPPMIAYVIYIFTHIFGNSELAIRLASNLFYSLTAIIVFLIAKEIFKKEKIALLSGLSYIILPGISYLSLIISTDALLSFFWA